jgi:colanic acid/amylovoran biosynthesis glycosyltransferase
MTSAGQSSHGRPAARPDPTPKVLYVTKLLPCGVSEAFILPEIASHLDAGWDVWLAPVQRGRIQHSYGAALTGRTLSVALLSPEVLGAAALEILSRPAGFIRALRTVVRSRSPGILAKNLAVVPKALWLARQLRREGFSHVHVHWAAVPATFGGLAAEIAGLDWSITAHRYDIAQDNLLDWKLDSASFVRAIDQAGASEICEAAPHRRAPLVLHMGVAIGDRIAPKVPGVLDPLCVVTGARFVEKKGHRYLIEAIRLAGLQGRRIEADFLGDGPLESILRAMVERAGISDQVRFAGPASHDALLDALSSGAYHLAVLPSVTAADGDKEGIPVFIMEAMAAGLPVVTTPNGGIVELAQGGAAMMVPERSAEALADALVGLSNDEAARMRLAVAGRERVLNEFEIEACMMKLRSLIAPATAAMPAGAAGCD